MPLVRFQLRNEYVLGKPELYKEANKEDPKAVLDGVAVAGLVGVLRQLGDLAEFAAEVFHGLQEQVMSTASRSRGLRARVKDIEAALPSLEKAVLRQTSHIHFAYTAGCEWHPHIKNERNHFISNDLPEFIMDSYEECRDPPNLHKLDKFDMGGSGSCLKRYSDPTFFKRVSNAKCDEEFHDKDRRSRKTRRNKKRGSLQINQELLHQEETYTGNVGVKFNSVVDGQASPYSSSSINTTIKSDVEENSNSLNLIERSFQRNGEVLQHMRAGGGSQRMQYTSEVEGKTSPYTASTVDSRTKSDLEDYAHQSRAGAAYIECVFHPSDSTHTPAKSMQSSSLRELSDNSVSSLVNDKLPYVSAEKEILSTSSSVTWDEKEEIEDNNGEQLDIAGGPIKLTSEENLVIADVADVDANNTKDMSALSSDVSIFKLGSGSCQADEIDSETENFMDALNTIESESENENDCLKKQEVEHLLSKFNSNGIIKMAHNVKNHEFPNFGSHATPDMPSSTSEEQELHDSVHELPPDRPEQRSPGFSPFTVSHDIETAPHNHEKLAMETALHNYVPHITENSVLDSLVDAGLSCNTVRINGSALDSQNTDRTRLCSDGSVLLDQSGDVMSTNFNEFEDFPDDFSSCKSVRFWTNGGLLGLEPSKPPAFTIPGSASQVSLVQMKRDMLDSQNHNATVIYENEAKLVSAAKLQHNHEDSIYGRTTPRYSSQEDQISDKRPSLQSSDADIYSHLDCQKNSFLQVNGETLDHIKPKAPGSTTLVAPNMNMKSMETTFISDCNQGVTENSSAVFGLGHRLLMNSLYRKVIGNKKSESATSGEDCEANENGLEGVANQFRPKSSVNENLVEASILESLTLSPPLEHMKISFKPVGRVEAPKLQLKFSDVSHSHASARDMFPSFQLVPDAGVSLHGSDSNSDDDDTFCRSCPYGGSDDCLSQNSGCDSDQWESSESEKQGRQDPVEYHSSHRSASPESTSSSQELKGSSNPRIGNGHSMYLENEFGTSPHVTLLDFPSFDTMNPLLGQESKGNLNSKNFSKSESVVETAPIPPPLPPKHWCASKSLSGIAGRKSNNVSEHVDDGKLLEQSFPQQPRQATVIKKPSYEEELAHAVKRRLDRQMLNGQKEANDMTSCRALDVEDDFLHQIRTKSFNLRRMAPTKSDVATGPVTNVNVTAILEKASAIRQVVASDDGEDEDSWSDT